MLCFNEPPCAGIAQVAERFDEKITEEREEEMKNEMGKNGKSSQSLLASVGCVVLGSFAAVASGCGQSASASASSGPGAAPGATALAAEVAPAAAMPVRISRAFFEKSVEGELRIVSSAPGQGPVQTSVSWSESGPIGDAPVATAETGAVLADFRDSRGCANLRDADGVEVCFKLMGDVSSVGLNAREMEATRLGGWVGRQVGQPCPGVEWQTRFAGAERSPADGPQAFTVTFVAEPGSLECAAEPVKAQITLRAAQ